MNLSNMIRGIADHPDSLVLSRTVSGDAVSRSFRQFFADVSELKQNLVEAGLGQGDLVGIQAGNSYQWLVWDLAVLQIGAILQPYPEGLDDLAQHGRADLRMFVTDREGGLPMAPPFDQYFQEAAAGRRAPLEGEFSRAYSSGTTGHLKGLRISRRGAEHLITAFIDAYGVGARDRTVVFLPLSHFQQRMTVYGCLSAGCSFFITDFVHSFADIRRFGPSFLVAPPAFYEALMGISVPVGANKPAPGLLRRNLGGDPRFLVTGMAPIRPALLKAFEESGIELFEAYGTNETGMIAWNVPGARRSGSVGRPVAGNDIRFVEGEIHIRSEAPLSLGYFDADEQLAATVFLADGFIATGDVGHIEDRFLVLDGRVKDVIVTGGGLKFHPLELEQRMLDDPAVSQCIVTSDAACVVTAIVSGPEFDSGTSRVRVRELVAAMNRQIPQHKRISRIGFTAVVFSPENGLLTRTMKYDRRAISERFLGNDTGEIVYECL